MAKIATISKISIVNFIQTTLSLILVVSKKTTWAAGG
jgi:hypothetical protein